MIRFFTLLNICLFAGNFISAQTPVWATDVAPILYKHCVTCHRIGGVGDFPLETLPDAQTNAFNMLNAVQSKYMPPWRADPNYRHFRDENVLSSAEIQTISDWVNGGQPAGDLSQAPVLPNFQNGSQLSSVDIAIDVPSYTLNTASDIYRAFAIPTGVGMDKFFNEIEFMPGNDAIIHHIVVYTDPTNEPVLKDLADPGPGWSTNGMVGNITQNSSLIAEWTPGGTPIKLPPQFGYRIPENGYFIVEMHFAPNHLNQTDMGTIINLHLTIDNPRELYYGVLTSADSTYGLLNPPFLIPANEQRTLVSEASVGDLVPVPISIFTLTPHAHIFGKSFKSYAYLPNETDTIPLINVPIWDFYWQSTYTTRKPIKLDPSYTTHADVTYDNTINNPQQPFSPPKDVYWGEKTTNEMLFLFATVAIYEPGDENIVLDSLLLATRPEILPENGGFSVANPVSDALDIWAKTPVNGISDLILTDINGKNVRQWRERDFTHSRISIAELPKGIYILQIKQAQGVNCFKLLKI
jgi:hypothetical protein